MKIAVLGSGSGALAAAADLTEAHHEVWLWQRSADKSRQWRESGNRMRLQDFNGLRQVQLQNVTHKLADAVEGAELIIVAVPVSAQSAVATQLAEHLVDGQMVLVPAGYMGSLVMAKRVHEAGNEAGVAFIETACPPSIARKTNDQQVEIRTRATRMPVGVFPARFKAHTLERLRLCYPAAETTTSVLDAALQNVSPCLRGSLLLLKASTFEQKCIIDIDAEAATLSPVTRQVLETLDTERLQIRKKLRLPLDVAGCHEVYGSSLDSSYYARLQQDWMVDSGHRTEFASLSQHRFMREDVQHGLTLLVSIAQWTKSSVPTMRGILALASAVAADNFLLNGRSLTSMGLTHLDEDDMEDLLMEGFDAHRVSWVPRVA